MYSLKKSVLAMGILLSGAISVNAQETQVLPEDEICAGFMTLVHSSQDYHKSLMGAKISETDEEWPIHSSTFRFPGLNQSVIVVVTPDSWVEYRTGTLYTPAQHDEALALTNRLLADMKRCGYGTGVANPYAKSHQRIFNWYTAATTDSEGGNYLTSITLLLEQRPDGYPVSLRVSRSLNYPFRTTTVEAQKTIPLPDASAAPIIPGSGPPVAQPTGEEPYALKVFRNMWAEVNQQLDELSNLAEIISGDSTYIEWLNAKTESLKLIASLRFKLKEYQSTYGGQIDSKAQSAIYTVLTQLDNTEQELNLRQYQE